MILRVAKADFIDLNRCTDFGLSLIRIHEKVFLMFIFSFDGKTYKQFALLESPDLILGLHEALGDFSEKLSDHLKSSIKYYDIWSETKGLDLSSLMLDAQMNSDTAKLGAQLGC